MVAAHLVESRRYRVHTWSTVLLEVTPAACDKTHSPPTCPTWRGFFAPSLLVLESNPNKKTSTGVHFFFFFSASSSSVSSVFPVLSFSFCRNPKNLNPRLMFQKNLLHRFPLPVSFWFSSQQQQRQQQQPQKLLRDHQQKIWSEIQNWDELKNFELRRMCWISWSWSQEIGEKKPWQLMKIHRQLDDVGGFLGCCAIVKNKPGFFF